MRRPDPPAAPQGRDLPPRFRDLAIRARTSRASAVKMFCAECVGFVTADVRDCTARQCPLWPWRPYQRGDEDATDPENLGVSDSPAGAADAEDIPDAPA